LPRGKVPSVKDTFVDDLGQHWIITSQERVPGDSIFLMEATRA